MGTSVSFVDDDTFVFADTALTATCRFSITFSGSVDSATNPASMSGTYNGSQLTCTAGNANVSEDIDFTGSGPFTGAKQSSSVLGGRGRSLLSEASSLGRLQIEAARRANARGGAQ